MNISDVVILNSSHSNKHFAGRIGFVIDKYVHNDGDGEWRYDVQFSYNPERRKDEQGSSVFEQLQVGESEITLLQSY